MKNQMIKNLLALLAILCTATFCISSEYMPLDQGLQWTFSDNVQASIGDMASINDVDAVPLSFWWPQLNGVRFWLVDDPAGPMLVDATVNEGSFNGHEWNACSWTFVFETPVRLFELPLTQGAELFDIIPSEMGDIFLLRTVGEEVNLDTPYGILPAYSVHLFDISGIFPTTVLYVNAELGPVGFNGAMLVDFNGIVEVEQRPLSYIKSLYR